MQTAPPSRVLRPPNRAHTIGALISCALTKHGEGTAADIYTWIEGSEIGVTERVVACTCRNLVVWGVLDVTGRSGKTNKSHVFAVRAQPAITSDDAPEPAPRVRHGRQAAVGATIFVIIRDLSEVWEVPKPFRGMKLADLHQHLQARLQCTLHLSGTWRVCQTLRTHKILRSVALLSDRHIGIHSLLGVNHVVLG